MVSRDSNLYRTSGHLTHRKETSTNQMKIQRMNNLLTFTQTDLWNFSLNFVLIAKPLHKLMIKVKTPSIVKRFEKMDFFI